MIAMDLKAIWEMSVKRPSHNVLYDNADRPMTDDLITGLEELSEAAFGYGLIVGWFLAGLCVLVLKKLYDRCQNRSYTRKLVTR